MSSWSLSCIVKVSRSPLKNVFEKILYKPYAPTSGGVHAYTFSLAVTDFCFKHNVNNSFSNQFGISGLLVTSIESFNVSFQLFSLCFEP